MSKQKLQISLILAMSTLPLLSEAQTPSITSGEGLSGFSSTISNTLDTRVPTTSSCHETRLPPAEVADILASLSLNGTADALFTVVPTSALLPVTNSTSNSTQPYNITTTTTSTLFNATTFTTTVNTTLFNASSVEILPISAAPVSQTGAASLLGTTRFTYFGNSSSTVNEDFSTNEAAPTVDTSLPELTAAPVAVSYVTVTETITAYLPCSEQDQNAAGTRTGRLGISVFPADIVAEIPTAASSDMSHAVGARFTTTLPTNIPTSGPTRSDVLVAPGLTPGESMVCSVLTTVIRV